MRKNTMYTPDSFVVLKIETNEGTHYRVLAGWSGGYLDGDSWRMNSGIESITQDEQYWYFHGATGSIYKCPKFREQFSAITREIYSDIAKNEHLKIETMGAEELYATLGE